MFKKIGLVVIIGLSLGFADGAALVKKLNNVPCDSLQELEMSNPQVVVWPRKVIKLPSALVNVGPTRAVRGIDSKGPWELQFTVSGTYIYFTNCSTRQTLDGPDQLAKVYNSHFVSCDNCFSLKSRSLQAAAHQTLKNSYAQDYPAEMIEKWSPVKK